MFVHRGRQRRFIKLLGLVVAVSVLLTILNDPRGNRTLKTCPTQASLFVPEDVRLLANSSGMLLDEGVINLAGEVSALPETEEQWIHENASDLVYVTSVYLLPGNLIRALTVRRCSLPKQFRLVYQLNGSAGVSRVSDVVSWRVIGPQCPWWYNTQCAYVGFYMEAKVSDKLRHDVPLRLLSEHRVGNTTRAIKSFEVALPPLKVISSVSNKKHFLSVCLQPVFYFADWQLVVQFMEFWLLEGVTKFLIYYQSAAKEVYDIIRLYQRDGVDIELVDWSVFPTFEAHDDANTLTYRTEHITAINDCAHRSRAFAEFTAFIDWDEFIVQLGWKAPLKFVDYLKTLAKKYPTAGAFGFKSSNVHFPLNESAAIESSEPEGVSERVAASRLSFDRLRSVERDREVVAFSSRSKFVARPERVLRAHVHNVMEFERRPGKGGGGGGSKKKGGMPRYSMKVVGEQEALVYHLRGVWPATRTWGNSTTDTHLSRYATPMRDGWTARLRRAASGGDLTLVSRGRATMQQLDACIQTLFAKRNQRCMAPLHCRQNVTTVQDDEWRRARQSWTVVY